MPRNPNRHQRGPHPKHNITDYELGKLHIVKTDNPESSRVILRRQAELNGLRSIISVSDDHVKLVLWNDKMLKKRK